MKKILITTSSFGKNDKSILDLLTTKGYSYELNPHGRKLTKDEAIELITKYQPIGMIAGVEPLNRDVLICAEKLKVISRCGIGLDNVDLATARSLGITVINTPDAPTIPVAELTIGMILSLLRKIHRSDYSIRNNEWVRPMGNLLFKKTVGIIGCGRIGSYVAKLLEPFTVNIIGFDPVTTDQCNIEFVNIEELLKKSDIITIHMPYSDNNKHFVNTDFLKQMKKGAVIINAARGGLVDENALYDVIKSGHLAGAALDCFEKEPYKGPLKEFDNVLLTGHIGSYALEGRIMMEKQAVENLFDKLDKIAR